MPDITEPIPYGLGSESSESVPVSVLFSHGSIAKMWFGGFSIAPYLTGISMSYKMGTFESTPFGEIHSTFAPGIEETGMSVEGFYDIDTVNPSSTLEKHLNDHRRDILPITYFPGFSTSVGDPAYMLRGRTKNYKVETSVSDAAGFEVDLIVSSVLSRGIVLKPDSLEVTSGNSVAYDSGATRKGMKALLSVSIVGGVTPELMVTLQHSADNMTWSDLFEFQPVQSISAEFLQNQNLVSERYIRVAWTMGGTSPSFTFNVAMSQSGNFK